MKIIKTLCDICKQEVDMKSNRYGQLSFYRCNNENWSGTKKAELCLSCATKIECFLKEMGLEIEETTNIF